MSDFLIFYAVGAAVVGSLAVLARPEKAEVVIAGRELRHPRTFSCILAALLWPAVIVLMIIEPLTRRKGKE